MNPNLVDKSNWLLTQIPNIKMSIIKRNLFEFDERHTKTLDCWRRCLFQSWRKKESSTYLVLHLKKKMKTKEKIEFRIIRNQFERIFNRFICLQRNVNLFSVHGMISTVETNTRPCSCSPISSDWFSSRISQGE